MTFVFWKKKAQNLTGNHHLKRWWNPNWESHLNSRDYWPTAQLPEAQDSLRPKMAHPFLKSFLFKPFVDYIYDFEKIKWHK